jgi:Ca2+-binding EF-hand superfamily protein
MITTLIFAVLAQTQSVQFAEVLDLDGDGIIHPMEAADAIEMLYEEQGVGLPVNEVDSLVQEVQLYKVEDAEFFIKDFDENGDGLIQLDEVPAELLQLVKYADLNHDSVISVQEVIQVNPDSVEVFAQMEIDEIFLDLDTNEDGVIEMDILIEDDPDFAKLVENFDANNDSAISRNEMVDGFAVLDASASFEVEDDVSYMHGTIDESTPFRIMELVYYHPEVKTIIMVDVPGSVDDDSSLRASRIVRNHGLNTHVPSDGEVASGGTDFFQAGVSRTCEKGAKFGVHSWSEFGAEGTDYPRDDEVHQMYLDYCDEMGIPQSFYWYTLDAASADDIHYMTDSELSTFSMLTAPILLPSAEPEALPAVN